MYLCPRFEIVKSSKNKNWVATGLLSLLLIMSVGMYLFKNTDVQSMFEGFGYSTYLIYPLAAAKLSAVAVLLSQKQSKIKEWAYAALFFEFVLTFFTHVMISDGEQTGALITITLLLISYFTEKKLFNKTI